MQQSYCLQADIHPHHISRRQVAYEVATLSIKCLSHIGDIRPCHASRKQIAEVTQEIVPQMV